MENKPQIIIYSTHTCNFCKLEKAWFESRNISFTNYFVDEDQEKAKEMIELSGQRSVPFTRIVQDGEETHIVGFHEDLLKGILGVEN
jgi:glutaredoxin